jgi:hypothetical protein
MTFTRRRSERYIGIGLIVRVLVTVAVLAALGASCGWSGAQRPQAITQRQEAAIHAALRLKNERGILAVFPNHVGSRRCVIQGGAFGFHVAGVCSTRVTLEGDGSALVGFVERWPKKSFHAEMGMIRYGNGCNGLPTRPSRKLSFAWEFRVTSNGHARPTCQYGDFPPQHVR